MEAITKELCNVEDTTKALKRIPMAQAKQLEREGKLKLAPGKFVFTVKLPAELSKGVPSTATWKRKARLVKSFAGTKSTWTRILPCLSKELRQRAFA